MAELPVCRRPTNLVGGDTASQHEVVAHTNVSGPALAQTTRPVANALSTEGQFGAVIACLRLTGAAQRGVRVHCLTNFPSQKFGQLILSSAASQGRSPNPYAW